MNPDIWVALITLVGTIVTVIVTSRSTQSKMMNELKTQDEVQNTRIDQVCSSISDTKDQISYKIEGIQELNNLKFDNLAKEVVEMKEDIKSHNHYAQLFSETVPVLKEKMTVANHRIDDIEKIIRDTKE